MTLFNWILLGAIAIVGFVAVLGLSRPEPVTKVVEVIKEQLGASAGPVHTELEEFLSGLVYGGNPCTSTSTIAAVGTLQGTGDTSLNRESVTCINFTVNQADVTLTLAASTSVWYPRAVGASKTLYIRNASTTATADIILAGGGTTGINLKGVASTTSVTNKTILGDTGGDNYAVIEFIRQADTDVNAHVTIFQD